jgi:hypothetical protein
MEETKKNIAIVLIIFFGFLFYMYVLMTTVDIIDNFGHRILDEQRDPANAYKMGAGHINVSKVLHETSGGRGGLSPLDPSLVVADGAQHLGTPIGDRDEDPRRGRPREH